MSTERSPEDSIEVFTSDSDDFSSLLEWLESDIATKGLQITTRSATAADQMGGHEILMLALDSANVIAVLGAIRSWIKYRQPSVKMKLRSKNGRTVEVETNNAGNVKDIAEALDLHVD
jgi:hypothetical protein